MSVQAQHINIINIYKMMLKSSLKHVTESFEQSFLLVIFIITLASVVRIEHIIVSCVRRNTLGRNS